MGTTSILNFWQGEVWRTLALLVATVAIVAFFQSVWVVVTKRWWMPRRLRGIMEQQGWKGPPFHLGVGSIPEVIEFFNEQASSPLAIRDFDTMSRVIPQYALFSKRYGKQFESSVASNQTQYVSAQNVGNDNFLALKLHVTLRIKVVAKIKILAGNQVVQL
jgi:hypothetical protein